MKIMNSERVSFDPGVTMGSEMLLPKPHAFEASSSSIYRCGVCNLPIDDEVHQMQLPLEGL